MATSDPLSIRQLQVFVALVEKGSFTRAARHLGLSQSTVSGHIADLEGRLGMRVVGRERSGVQPTSAGKILLQPAREALQSESNLRMAAAAISGVLSGTLSVGGSTIPAAYLLPRLVGAFRARHEGISINLLTGDSGGVVELVQQGEVEVGLVGGAAPARGLLCEPFEGDELVLVLPREHPLAGARSITREQAVALPFVLREEGSGTRATMLAALGVSDADRELQVVCQVGSTDAAKGAVRAGLGATFLSSLAVAGDVQSGALAMVDVEGLRLQRSFYLVARSLERLSPAGRGFWVETLGK